MGDAGRSGGFLARVLHRNLIVRRHKVNGMSVVEQNHKQLEAIGDYVTRANVGWFAVFPDKLQRLKQLAATNHRGSNLVVYRTRSSTLRDHYVIPVSVLSELFAEEALTHSDVNQSIRWNVTLKGQVLRVSHSHHSVDVSRYFGLPLAIELGSVAVASTNARDLEPPPSERIATTVYRILRDTELARQLKRDYKFRCQICDHTIELPDGNRYAEVHHIRPLGRPHRGPDSLGNLIVLCPNHHAMCDYGAIALVLEDLHVIEGHNLDPKAIAYHNERICQAKQAQ